MSKRAAGPRAAGVAVALSLLGAARGAAAQSACEAAETDGMQRNQSGDHAGAYAQFERAFTQCHGARAHARMAIALMALGRWSNADAHMREVLAMRGDAWVDANRESLEQQLAVVSAHVGELVVTGNGTDGEVEVDGRRVATFPMRGGVRVTAGTVVVRVRAPGRHVVERSERVEPGRVSRIEVTLVPEAATAGDGAPGAAPRDGTVQRVLAWSAAGLAAVGLGVGIWGTVESNARRTAYDRDCPMGHPAEREPECSAQLNTVSDASVVVPQAVGYSAAGALAIASALLFATAPPTRSGTRAWVCGPGPGTVGIGCDVRF